MSQYGGHSYTSQPTSYTAIRFEDLPNQPTPYLESLPTHILACLPAATLERLSPSALSGLPAAKLTTLSPSTLARLPKFATDRVLAYRENLPGISAPQLQPTSQVDLSEVPRERVPRENYAINEERTVYGINDQARATRVTAPPQPPAMVGPPRPIRNPLSFGMTSASPGPTRSDPPGPPSNVGTDDLDPLPGRRPFKTRPKYSRTRLSMQDLVVRSVDDLGVGDDWEAELAQLRTEKSAIAETVRMMLTSAGLPAPSPHEGDNLVKQLRDLDAALRLQAKNRKEFRAAADTEEANHRAALEKKAQQLTEELVSSRDEQTALKSTLALVTGNMNRAEKQRAVIEKNLQELRSSREKDAGQRNSWKTQTQDLKKSLETELGRATDLERRVQDLTKELETATGQRTALELRTQDMTNDLETATGRCTALELRTQDLTKDLETATSERTALELRTQDLTKALETATSERTGLELRLKDLAQDLEKATTRHATDSTTIADLTAKLDAQAASLTSKLDAQTASLTFHQTTIADLTNALATEKAAHEATVSSHTSTHEALLKTHEAELQASQEDIHAADARREEALETLLEEHTKEMSALRGGYEKQLAVMKVECKREVEMKERWYRREKDLLHGLIGKLEGELGRGGSKEKGEEEVGEEKGGGKEGLEEHGDGEANAELFVHWVPCPWNERVQEKEMVEGDWEVKEGGGVEVKEGGGAEENDKEEREVDASGKALTYRKFAMYEGNAGERTNPHRRRTTTPRQRRRSPSPQRPSRS